MKIIAYYLGTPLSVMIECANLLFMRINQNILYCVQLKKRLRLWQIVTFKANIIFKKFQLLDTSYEGKVMQTATRSFRDIHIVLFVL